METKVPCLEIHRESSKGTCQPTSSKQFRLDGIARRFGHHLLMTIVWVNAVMLGLGGSLDSTLFSNRASGQCTTAWATGTDIPPGLNGTVSTSVVFDAGTGPALYVGRLFTMAGTTTVNRIARWNGTAWSALSVGPNVGVNGTVFALAVEDLDGAGGNPPALYAGGDACRAPELSRSPSIHVAVDPCGLGGGVMDV